MTSPWFPGAGRTLDDETFLAALRSAADEHGLVDATPAGTGCAGWDDALVLTVEVPAVQDTRAKPVLEVLLTRGAAPELWCGVETHGYLTEDADPMDLTGVERTPAAWGRQAFDWFTAQLQRPVERASWRTWRGERSLLRFADDGELIESAFLRRPTRAPDCVVRLR